MPRKLCVTLQSQLLGVDGQWNVRDQDQDQDHMVRFEGHEESKYEKRQSKKKTESCSILLINFVLLHTI